jgi:hypothetical protein
VSSRPQRHLGWEGCFNVRDLGGLRTTDGRDTRWGRVVRADGLDGLTADGWAALSAHGVRTVIDLRNDDELGADAAPRPASVRTIHLPLDASKDREFWDIWDSGPQFGTPLYYRPHLERFPERSAAVLSAIARAEPGGVAFHCGGGRDRAGQVSMLLLGRRSKRSSLTAALRPPSSSRRRCATSTSKPPCSTPDSPARTTARCGAGCSTRASREEPRWRPAHRAARPERRSLQLKARQRLW